MLNLTYFSFQFFTPSFTLLGVERDTSPFTETHKAVGTLNNTLTRELETVMNDMERELKELQEVLTYTKASREWPENEQKNT